MKRNENLVLLSRDHHFGLLYCWKIKQGIKKDISFTRIRNYINYFWIESLSKHFKVEDIVLPETGNDSLQIQMDKEHREIRKMISSINQSENMQLLADFADALQSHIRFEERVLFPHLEKNLSEEEMDEVGKKLIKYHQKEADNYPDEFWK
ncbi:hemerythrin domain-containing protein [Chryseobacterium oryctis]|uniref:Hemerythrin domain-containing protein n=1 Tax=Chryseobacterium oryctis TaxID=2952618 RepID=A0ABT3HPC1_9FLAO|nr:hemerythrin domain-containing protein [Chryseobacterium oryctis]MCW3161622.1 hemerythrin domain-containing protein [Chryseobacterium oryctis]